MEEEFDATSDGGGTPVLDEPEYESGDDESHNVQQPWKSTAEATEGGESSRDRTAASEESGPASPDYEEGGAHDDAESSASRSPAAPGSGPASPDADLSSPDVRSSGLASPDDSAVSPSSPSPEEETSVQEFGTVGQRRPEEPMSPDQHASSSPAGSALQSPAPSGPQSPTLSGPQSPASSRSGSAASPLPRSPGLQGSKSPTSSGPQSPASRSAPRSPASISGPASPASASGPPLSPASAMGPQSPASSGPSSPAASAERKSPASPSGPQSPASPFGPQSPASPSGPQSPASPSGPQSPDSPSGSQAPASPSGPVSPASLSAPQSPTSYQSTGNERKTRASPDKQKKSKGKESRRVRIASSSSDEGDDVEPPAERAKASATHSLRSDDEDQPQSKKPSKAVASDSDDSDFEAFEETNFKERSRVSRHGDGDADDSDKESAEGDELMADIFGSSDEEFEGFVESEVKKPSHVDDDDDDGEEDDMSGVEDDSDEKAAAKPKASSVEGASDRDITVKEKKIRPDFVSDFEEMMKKKKEEQASRRRKRKNVDIINDNDDLIVNLIKKMKEAAEGDRTLNDAKQPAIKKLKLLPLVMQQLNKAELQSAFLDCGVLGAITEWLAPLPDKSLPHLHVREGLLKILSLFPTPTSDMLKSSGTGKAVMYLYKHPRETRKNKEIAGKLINEWSRPIFGHATKYMSKDEREQRDHQLAPKRRKSSNSDTPGGKNDGATEGEQKAPLRPGDAGWISRARVPAPSTRDYVVRPKWNVEELSAAKNVKKAVSRYEKQKRAFQERKKVSKQQRAVTISIEGRNMAL